jgi:hypothetical protein
MFAESKCRACDFARSAQFTKGDRWLYDEYRRVVRAHEAATQHTVDTIEVFPEFDRQEA